MSSSARVSSIAALAQFKAALQEFASDVSDVLVQLTLEARKPVEWVTEDRTRYWPGELRKASDALAEARLALQRCELTIDGERRSCTDERKQFERAKRRVQTCEAKIPVVRRWCPEIRKESEDFEVQCHKLARYLELELVRAQAALERMTAALEQYAASSASKVSTQTADSDSAPGSAGDAS